MKQLYLIRHAKSSWADAGASDFSRPLNERGKKDGHTMAEIFSKKKIQVDMILCSSALRTRKTASYFSKALNFREKDISYLDELYHASSDTIYSVISNIENSLSSVMIICHNPGITDFINSLTSEIQIDNMPTCGIFGISTDIKEWIEFEKAEKKFLFFDYPKLF